MCQSHDYNTADTGDRLSRATVPVHWTWTTQKVCRKSLQLFMKHEHQINQLTNCHRRLHGNEQFRRHNHYTPPSHLTAQVLSRTACIKSWRRSSKPSYIYDLLHVCKIIQRWNNVRNDLPKTRDKSWGQLQRALYDRHYTVPRWSLVQESTDPG